MRRVRAGSTMAPQSAFLGEKALLPQRLQLRFRKPWRLLQGKEGVGWTLEVARLLPKLTLGRDTLLEQARAALPGLPQGDSPRESRQNFLLLQVTLETPRPKGWSL